MVNVVGGSLRGRHEICRTRHSHGPRCQAQLQAPRYTAGNASKPPWAGGGFMSDVANLLIAIPPVYAVLKVAARELLRQGAERQGIPWNATVQRLRKDEELQALLTAIEDKELSYPAYYLRPFHAYSRGNMEWLAAYEAEPATLSMAMRAWRDPTITPFKAHELLRSTIIGLLKDFTAQHQGRPVHDILDAGCSVGMSTEALAIAYPGKKVVGLDLSPFFLAVAEQRNRLLGTMGTIRYVHGKAEAAPFADASFDVVSLQYVIHECPADVITELVREAKRLLRPGGTLMLVDIDPKSSVVQNLPAFVATLQKSTEPYSDEYYNYDLQEQLQAEGYVHVVSKPCSARHRCVLAMKP